MIKVCDMIIKKKKLYNKRGERVVRPEHKTPKWGGGEEEGGAGSYLKSRHQKSLWSHNLFVEEEVVYNKPVILIFK